MSNHLFIVLRGLPGSGKSTTCTEIERMTKENGLTFFAWSADRYFIKNGKYVFDAAQLPLAHDDCWMRIVSAFGKRTHVVVLDNTNIKRENFAHYLKAAKSLGYKTREIVVGSFGADDIREYYTRNIHGVPLSVIERMAQEFEQ